MNLRLRFLGDDTPHIVPFLFHVRRELELRPRTVKILPFAVDGKVQIAVDMVGQKPYAALQRYCFRPQRKELQLPGGQIRAGADISARENAEALQTHLHLGEIALVLRRGRSAVADGVAEIKEA